MFSETIAAAGENFAVRGSFLRNCVMQMNGIGKRGKPFREEEIRNPPDRVLQVPRTYFCIQIP